MSEKILGFDSEGMQKGKKYVTFRTDKLVPVVSIKWLHNRLWKLYLSGKLETLEDIDNFTVEITKKAGVQRK